MNRIREMQRREFTFLWCCCIIYSFLDLTATPNRVVGQASSSLPAPIVATWTTLSQQAASISDGIPAGRCDHAFQKLSGQALRTNKGVPFHSGSAPGTDPFPQTMWLYGGHQDEQYNDTWLLDLGATIPTWHKLHYPLDDGSAHPRSGFGVATIPNGLSGGDTGLTGLIFGGYNNVEYLGDVSTLNFGDATQREVIPEVLSTSDSQPFARAKMQWVSLPGGSGSGGPINSSVDEGLFYVFGGIGASDGIRFGDNDHDLAEEWIFSAATLQWTRLGTDTCLQNTTICSDAVPLTDILTTFPTPANATLDFITPLRPSEVYPIVQTLVTSISNENLQSNTYQDVPNACTTSCAAYAVDSNRFSPPMAQGARMVVLGAYLYLFGGYNCGLNGVLTTGGDDCFGNTLYIMSLSDFTWTSVEPPPADSEWAPYHPSKRAYHTMSVHEGLGLVFVIGGAFQDVSGSFYYYNDVLAFDVKLQRFVPFTARGTAPPIHWSAGLQTEGNGLVLYGGCLGNTYYDQLMVLRLDIDISAANCYAYGSGLSEAIAGETAVFYIQTRETKSVFNTALNRTESVFGANATYGTGLIFSAQLVASDTPAGSLVLYHTKVSEIGNGLYSVSYTALAGTNFRIFIYYQENTQIPGSPFNMVLHPMPIIDPSQCTASGYGTSLAVKGDDATVTVEVKDQFGNQFTDNSFDTSPNLTFNFSVVMTEVGQTTVAKLAVQATDNGDGSFSLTYSVPSSTGDYYLSISLNDQELADSPYLVQSIDPIVLPSSLVDAIWFLVFLNIALCLCSSVAVIHFRHESVMRSSSPNFLHLLIFGSILSSLSVIFLIVDVTDSTCQAFHSFLSIGLVTGLGALLAKSHRVARIFNAKQLKVQTNNSDLRLFIPTAIGILCMVLLNVLWIGISPMHVVYRASSKPEYAAVQTFPICSETDGDAWIGVIIAFCGAVLAYGVYLAIKTGHVPEQFNESKVIASATYNIFICCVIVVPLLFFIGGSSEFLIGRTVIEALAILWCSLFTVLALIVPKLLLLYRTDGRRGSISPAGTLSPTHVLSMADGHDDKSDAVVRDLAFVTSSDGSSAKGAAGTMLAIAKMKQYSQRNLHATKRGSMVIPASRRASLGLGIGNQLIRTHHLTSSSSGSTAFNRRTSSQRMSGPLAISPKNLNVSLPGSTQAVEISPSASGSLRQLDDTIPVDTTLLIPPSSSMSGGSSDDASEDIRPLASLPSVIESPMAHSIGTGPLPLPSQAWTHEIVQTL